MKLALILLAAGDSRRFNGNKLLHEFKGKPMYQYILGEVEVLPDGIFDKKMVVTQYQEIMDTMEHYGYEVVVNRESSLGISHSIHLALKELENEETDYCFAVCDQPYLKAATIRDLVEGWRDSGKGIGCLCNMGALGNPAIFSRNYLKELLELKGDVGGKRVIRRHIEDLYLHEVVDGLELVDIDVRNNSES
ncbi:MAG: nucleotidyltransferase family protein [Hungatella sp.]|jgi:molybdenum cofactor cytidylyltransferase|uniref:NTP transferase domain-containing protein n=1 Tax=Clostridium sp. NkU-1 TaxID=1095009 RepID=UPI0006D0D3C2|nr:nucleotidyltransferase family protein [Hungatella sp.]MDR1550515.1 nucleotidyltransferase family protein [Hungatella sp.]MDR1769592.1 nucleotidyltransferase family protein [Hungatella sp.]MDR2025875.1 nucleotidyltransferase family protein [Hungatella sp.]